jgi:Transposase DDE domain group 1
MAESHSCHSMCWTAGSQPLLVDFQAGCLVEDAGLLVVRELDVSLGVLADLAGRLPDPRSAKYIQHTLQTLLVQQVYQFLAGYPDGNDADHCRNDALFQILAGFAPDPNKPLACTSTLNRFLYGYTRKDAELPREERPSLLQQRRAQIQRLRACNDFLVDLFIRTRTAPPQEIILDPDATDDPVHGQQALSGYHGYYRQHQYLPLLVFEGHTGFPLACWLRPGTMHAACGAIDVLRPLVERLRQVWPGVMIRLRADNGLAVPAVLDYCEEAKLGYALGYASNAVLQRASEHWLKEVELVHNFYGYRDPHMQRFEDVPGYQSSGWSHPRRVVVKVEVTPQGSQRRFVVTNLQESARPLYQDFYVQRGEVPERPIGELKNGLSADRLSSCGFCANALKMLVAVVAYALVVLYRQACANLEGVGNAEVGTLRSRLWKVPGEVLRQGDAVRVRLPRDWQERQTWEQTLLAVRQHAAALEQVGEPPGGPQQAT